jgi:hypothetical protein
VGKIVYGRAVLAGGRHVQLGDKKRVIFEHSPEAEAVSRWSKDEFLELERNIARQWRRALTGIDLKARHTPSSARGGFPG